MAPTVVENENLLRPDVKPTMRMTVPTIGPCPLPEGALLDRYRRTGAYDVSRHHVPSCHHDMPGPCFVSSAVAQMAHEDAVGPVVRLDHEAREADANGVVGAVQSAVVEPRRQTLFGRGDAGEARHEFLRQQAGDHGIAVREMVDVVVAAVVFVGKQRVVV